MARFSSWIVGFRRFCLTTKSRTPALVAGLRPSRCRPSIAWPSAFRSPRAGRRRPPGSPGWRATRSASRARPRRHRSPPAPGRARRSPRRRSASTASLEHDRVAVADARPARRRSAWWAKASRWRSAIRPQPTRAKRILRLLSSSGPGTRRIVTPDLRPLPPGSRKLFHPPWLGPDREHAHFPRGLRGQMTSPARYSAASRAPSVAGTSTSTVGRSAAARSRERGLERLQPVGAHDRGHDGAGIELAHPRGEGERIGHRIDLVEHEHLGPLGEAQLGKHRLHHGDVLFPVVVARRPPRGAAGRRRWLPRAWRGSSRPDGAAACG